MAVSFDAIAQMANGFSEEQKVLMSSACAPFLAGGKPVVFQYLDRTMKAMGMDAASTLASLPYIQSTSTDRRRYSLLRYDGFSVIRPDLEIQPTVAGLYVSGHDAGMRAAVMFLQVVGLFQKAHEQAPASAHSVVPVKILSRDIDQALPVHLHAFIHTLEPLARFEFPTQGCNKVPNPPSPIDQEWDISSFTPIFSHEPSIEEYISQVHFLIAPTKEPVASPSVSPLALSAALDYLATVWELKIGGRLLFIPNAERLTKLSLPVESEDELASRLSGLKEIWDDLTVPMITGAKGSPLARMHGYIKSIHAGLDDAPVESAVGIILASNHLRNGLQHASAGPRFEPSLQKFDLSYPITDHGLAWRVISAKVVQALTTIREEIQKAAP